MFKRKKLTGPFGRKKNIMDKTTFMNTLQETRAQWEALLAQIGEARMLQPGVVGTWSVKDVLAHVIWYEREMVILMRRRALAGSELWEVPLDERNAVIYQQNRDRPLPEISNEGQDTYAELVEAAQTLSDEDLNDPHRFQEMPENWIPWKVFASNSFEHYQEHMPALRRWVTQG